MMRTILAIPVVLSVTGTGVACEPVTHPARQIPPAQLLVTTRMVPLEIETNRMRGLNFDAQGNAWIAVVENDRRRVIKAHPTSGKARNVLVTDEPSTDALY